MQRDVMIPTARLLPIMADWIDRGGQRQHLNSGVNAWKSVLREPMVPEPVADRLLTALGRNDAWWLELNDIYEQLLEMEAA